MEHGNREWMGTNRKHQRPTHPGARPLGGVGVRQACELRAQVQQGGKWQATTCFWNELGTHHRGIRNCRERRQVQGRGVQADVDSQTPAPLIRQGEISG